MVWDLTQLVENADSANVQKKLESMVAEAEQIRREYHGKIGELDADGLLRLLEARDAFSVLKGQLGTAL